MKNFSKSLILAAAFFCYSCDNDDAGEKTLTPEEAKTSIETVTSEMEDDLVEMVNNEGTKALVDLLDLMWFADPFSRQMDPEEVSRKKIAQRVKKIRDVFVPESARLLSEDGGFDFESNLGVYDYDPDIFDFVQTTVGGDHIALNFPTEGSATNNATLRILDYKEIIFTENYDGWEFESYLVTILDADLSIDNTTLVQLELDVDYSDDGEVEDADISLSLTPYTYTLKFGSNTSEDFSLAFAVSKGSDKIMGTEVTISFASGDIDMLSKIDGEVYYRALAIRGNMDFSSLEDGESADINDFVNLSVYYEDSKVGDIVFDEMDGELIAYIEYADGSKELLEDLLEPIIDELEDFILELEGEG